MQLSLTDHTDRKLLQLNLRLVAALQHPKFLTRCVLKLYVKSHTVKWGTCRAPNPCLLQANICSYILACIIEHMYTA